MRGRELTWGERLFPCNLDAAVGDQATEALLYIGT